MKAPAEILAELDRRGWREIADQVASMHRLPLLQIIDTRCHELDIVDARRDLFTQFRPLVPSNAAVARLFGVDHSTVNVAMMASKQIAECKLDEFEVRAPEPGKPIGFIFKYRHGRENPFAVVTLCATAGENPGAWEKQTEWFRFYPQARTRFVTLTRDAGAPSSYAGPTTTADQVETTPAPAEVPS